MTITQQDLTMAFKKQDAHYLRKIHLYLNSAYYDIIYQKSPSMIKDADDWLVFKQVESVWLMHEINDCFNRYDCHQKVYSIGKVSEQLFNHPVYDHPLFHYLEKEASLNEMKKYLEQESILNMEFFDYLALALIGSPDIARKEIMKNMWDECGRGRLNHYHTNQFKACLKSLGLRYQRQQHLEMLSWEGLAGINYFSALAQSGCHKMKYYGFLAATELLDSPHYSRLIRGLRRVQAAGPINIKYYLEHECVDIKHSANWLAKIIFPMILKTPSLISDFWIGFYLRLDSAQRYYDFHYQSLMSRQAA